MITRLPTASTAGKLQLSFPFHHHKPGILAHDPASIFEAPIEAYGRGTSGPVLKTSQTERNTHAWCVLCEVIWRGNVSVQRHNGCKEGPI